LDVKLTEVQTTINKLEADIEIAKKEKEDAANDSEEHDDLVRDMTQQFVQVPRGT
jgi:hypothetical protein